MVKKAVIDRFEGDLAVLLLPDGDQRLNLPRKLLPPKAKEGSWLTLEMIGGEPRNIKLDPQATASARQRITAKLARLRKSHHK